MMTAEAAHIYNEIAPRLGAHTFLLGIDGMGTAGKTTLATALQELLEARGHTVTVLHADDFIHPRAVRYTDAHQPWECYYRVQWRYDYLIEELLHPIKTGLEVTKDIQLYDKPNDSYLLEPVRIPTGSVVILEGIFLGRPELRPFFDYMVYINVPEDVRLERARQRDGYIGDTAAIEAHYIRRYFPAEQYYEATHRPQLSADCVFIVPEARENIC